MDAGLACDMSFYDEFHSGKVVSRVLCDTLEFSDRVTHPIGLVKQLRMWAGV